MVLPTTGQGASILGTGAIGGQLKAGTNFNSSFGWGTKTNWGGRGFFQSRGSIHNREGRDPFGDVMNGAVNTQFEPWKRNEQAAPWASLWDTSKPCSQRRNSGAMGHRRSRKHSPHQLLNDQTFNQAAAVSTLANNNNFGWGTAQGGNHCSSHRLLKSKPSNQAAKQSVCTTRNNFGWGATNQAAAEPWSTFWGTSLVIPKPSSTATKRQSSKAIPKALSKG
ncbi:hypothetical protein HOLleu_11060 [Holothuria leucospilota]|uniref:Uncharacterized protein n=1 Tax=Holothuria leucospilota TaxID=206669 RepID=A0A9Q1CEE2_HOLLE|nr:hypothetical protein HOLleu_11060 [Holothuria leucospilota]